MKWYVLVIIFGVLALIGIGIGFESQRPIVQAPYQVVSVWSDDEGNTYEIRVDKANKRAWTVKNPGIYKGEE